MNTTLENEHIIYEQLDSGIHRIELKSNSLSSADAYLAMLDEVIGKAVEDNVDLLRMLIVISAEQMPSLQYLATGAKKVIAGHPRRPPLRNVYVFRHNFMANLLQMFIKMIVQRSKDKMSFYPLDKMDDAIAWLMEDM